MVQKKASHTLTNLSCWLLHPNWLVLFLCAAVKLQQYFGSLPPRPMRQIMIPLACASPGKTCQQIGFPGLRNVIATVGWFITIIGDPTYPSHSDWIFSR